jgi:murein DD-endopeptidase MepM/ murein hydrolase activator NlpD
VASELAAYFVSIVPSAKGLTGKIAKEFAGVDREAAKTGKSSGGAFTSAFKGALTGVAAAFSVGAITDFVSSAVDGAGKAEQSMGALDSVFKGSAGKMKDWSKDAAKNVGLTGNEFADLSVLIGSQLKNGGTAMDKLAPKTNALIGMGADLSSMFGGSTKDAVDALSSALKGERDPIEKYGVSLNQSKIDAEAAALGFEKVGGALSGEATQAATLSLITKQTADAHGNFAKESDTFAHKQEVMSAKWEDLKVKIGEQFMPALSGAFGFITDTAMPALGDFRDGLAQVGQWIKDNATWLGPLAVTIGAMAVGMGLWTGAISLWKTVTSIAAGVQIAFNAAIAANPIGLIIIGIIALVAGLVWFFTQTELGKQIIANVWGFIQTVVGGVVDWFTNTALPVIQQVFKTVGEVFTWLYENIIRPVFESVTTVIGGVWAFISGVFNLIVAVIQKVLAPAFQWLYNTIIKPVFDAIGAALQWVWDNTIKRIFDAWVWIFKNVLGPAFDWLWKTIIKPAFDGIGAAVKWVWENVLKPVFDTLGKFIKDTIPKAFDSGVKAIKTAWDKIQEIAKAPVKFVVNTIINDGLIAGFNSLAVPLGVKALDKVALPAGFANGGYTGNGGKYQPAGVVHAGEYVFTKEQTRRAGVSNLAGLAQSLNGYAKGGIVNPLKQMAITQGYNRIHKGVDFAASVGTPVFATQGGTVSWAGPGATAPGVWGGNEIHVLGNGIETWFAHLSQIGVKLGQNVRAGQQIGLSGNTGITSGPHLHFGTFAGGWPNDIDPLAYLGGAGIPSGGGGFNPIAGIVDGLVSKLKESIPGAGPFADMAIGVGKKILDGASKFVTDFLSGHSDKKGNATATVFDGGGWLENTGGSQLVQHNKRKPDAVLSHDQWATMSRIADNTRGAGVTFTGPVHVRDENELASIINTRQRDAQAAYGF